MDAVKVAKVVGYLALLGGASMAWIVIAGRLREEVREEIGEG